MDPGILNKKVTIVYEALVPDGMGGFIENPKQNLNIKVWANISPLSGKRFWEAQNEKAKVTHNITIRYNPEVKRDCVVIYKKRKFIVTHVINTDERNTELVLHCFEDI